MKNLMNAASTRTTESCPTIRPCVKDRLSECQSALARTSHDAGFFDSLTSALSAGDRYLLP